MSWLSNLSLPKIRDLVRKTETPETLWDKCPDCEQMVFRRDLEAAMHVCPHCGFHLRINRAGRAAWRTCSTTVPITRIELPDCAGRSLCAFATVNATANACATRNRRPARKDAAMIVAHGRDRRR